MLSHHGLMMSEPMAFGLSSALNFAYLPFVKLAGMPLIAYRSIPKAIIKGLQKNLGLKMKIETFSNQQKGQHCGSPVAGTLSQSKCYKQHKKKRR